MPVIPIWRASHPKNQNYIMNYNIPQIKYKGLPTLAQVQFYNLTLILIKNLGIGDILYYMKTLYNLYLFHSIIKPILYLSRLLISVKTKYWLIELELARLIWMFYKTRHIIKAFQYITIIYTGYRVALRIAKQVLLSFTSTNKLNLRLT